MGAYIGSKNWLPKLNKIVVLPIQEPWASMIANGDKKFEFRKWIPKWELGQEIWIVATGKAPKPRQVIAKCKYGGTYEVYSNAGDGYWRFYDVITKEYIQPHFYPSLRAIGGKKGDYALSMLDIQKFDKPFTLESIGIKRTPQKYQYTSLEEIGSYNISEANKKINWKEYSKQCLIK